MSASNLNTQASRSIRAEASAWIAKLHGPERSSALEADFRGWLSADAEHARAFEHVTEIWDSLGSVDVGGVPRLASHEAFERKPATLRPRLLAAACLIAAVSGALWWAMAAPLYSTGIGEQRVVRLEDGSRLSLDAQTRVTVDFSATQRVIQLKGGEVFCEVAKDATRPFRVIAGKRAVTALGTSFVVRYETDETSVTLVDGAVSVASLGAEPLSPGLSGSPAGQAQILRPGERLTLRDDRSAALDKPRPEATAAWRRGEVILDHTPLQDAIKEMNRYDRTRVVVDDAKLAQWPISGIYRLGNNRDFAQAVSVVYGLTVREKDDAVHLAAAPASSGLASPSED